MFYVLLPQREKERNLEKYPTVLRELLLMGYCGSF